MRPHPIIALVLLVALPLQSGHACLWDSDTLATEAAGKGKILDVIVGRFPRNPPAYYEARLARVTKEISETPDKLELYDDAGVACDRLHRSADAIAWMEKKAAVLERAANEEHQYRYHANLGTFLIHQWLSEGADLANDEGARGAEHIRAAIEINPDAHFGREAIQLQAIEWLLEERAVGISDRDTDPSTSNVFQRVSWFGYTYSNEDTERTIEGLAGMVALGSAWESIDIFRTLAACLFANRDASLAYLSELRVGELARSGKISLSDHFPENYTAGGEALKKSSHLVEWYAKARNAADAWQSARTGFIEKQIAAGQHPDTHPDFWKGFDEADYPRPRLPKDRPNRTTENLQAQARRNFVLGLVAVIIGVVALIVLRRLSRPAA